MRNLWGSRTFSSALPDSSRGGISEIRQTRSVWAKCDCGSTSPARSKRQGHSAVKPAGIRFEEGVADVRLVAANLPQRCHEIITGHRVRARPRLALAVRRGHLGYIRLAGPADDDRHGSGGYPWPIRCSVSIIPEASLKPAHASAPLGSLAAILQAPASARARVPRNSGRRFGESPLPRPNEGRSLAQPASASSRGCRSLRSASARTRVSSVAVKSSSPAWATAYFHLAASPRLSRSHNAERPGRAIACDRSHQPARPAFRAFDRRDRRPAVRSAAKGSCYGRRCDRHRLVDPCELVPDL
jgi:hypothetical protein